MPRSHVGKGTHVQESGRHYPVSPFITAAAMLGQMPVPQDVASKASDVLSLPEANEFLTEIPIRGSLGATDPIDPTIYRFYEIDQVYGTTLKARRAQINAERHVRFWHLADDAL